MTQSTPRNLVFICDGTLSSMESGQETNAGLLYRMMSESGQTNAQRIAYDAGIQGTGWRKWVAAASGLGINLSIEHGYTFLATHYRPGDRIFLFGYSRGAYAVRSLAGMIGKIGLLRREYATERHVHLAFRFYQIGSNSIARQHFSTHRCHTDPPIEMLGIWDTVKSLGLPYPIIHRLAPMATEFHDDQLGPNIRHGYHALAIDEDRTSYEPLLWRLSPDWQGRVEQAWFPGAHGDVGGEVRDLPAARSLSNISLNWMLRRAERCGMQLPADWEDRFLEEPSAPMMGCRRGIARLFLFRKPRNTGGGDGETVHLSIRDRMKGKPGYYPAAAMGAAPESES
ncbi:MAG: DUF2235 domain-containing protein [Paracoccaceae bacterium]